jgi:ribonucleoside-diphosphate reductase beta chain
MAAANDTLQLVNFFESTNTSYEVNAGGSSSKAMEGQSPSADRHENDPDNSILKK